MNREWKNNFAIQGLWDDYVCLEGNPKDHLTIDKVIKIVHEYIRPMVIDGLNNNIDYSPGEDE